MRGKGYVETMFGRKRFLPEINSAMQFMRSEAERMAVNSPIQGTAADIIKIAMVRIQDMIEKDFGAKKLKMILQIHDELLFEVSSPVLEEAAEKIKNIMEGVLESDVPIKVELSAGPNWAELEKLDL